MKRVGVIDVGTNSVRMLVAEGDSTLSNLERDLIITRLGEGVDRSKRLRAQAVTRTIDAIAGFVDRCEEAGADPIRIIATSAVRDATNRHAFLHGVRERTGLEPEILSGDDEARIGFAGATLAVDDPPPYLVCDIGGGSTELVAGTETAERFVSLDIGSVRMTERHVRSDPPHADELDAAREDARAHIQRARGTIGEVPHPTFIGLAGTITTVAAISLGLDGYDRDAIHHSRLSQEQIASIRARLASMTSEQRRALPAMPSGREDVIVAGVVILEEIMSAFALRACVVSETDILDGAALEIIDG